MCGARPGREASDGDVSGGREPSSAAREQPRMRKGIRRPPIRGAGPTVGFGLGRLHSMCGIAGKLFRDSAPSSPAPRAHDAILAHRGPDDSGIHHDGPVGLGARRLAILDLAPAGHQPMRASTAGSGSRTTARSTTSCELRAELERAGPVPLRQRHRGDPASLRARTGRTCLERLRGMFAFALWDRRRARCSLARDRMGKKPLFYYRTPSGSCSPPSPRRILQDPDVAVRAGPRRAASLPHLRVRAGPLVGLPRRAQASPRPLPRAPRRRRRAPAVLGASATRPKRSEASRR